MKRILLSIFILCVGHVCFSQADSSQPVYLRFPTIPLFTIYKASDSTAFTRDDLQKKKPTVFIIFSPDCEHCQHETEALIKNINKFKDVQIVMVDYLPHEEMVKFYNNYKIANYPEITMGRDAKFFFPIFFHVESLPAIYVYDKKGKFKQAFQGSVKIDKIADAL
ncbi:MAG: redoxin domain-containing protein [Bacteroidota bacterium]|nr:redoxin domain-containing protein [Bacteroidota bacterium]